jgi:DNA polymerase III delta prime subunit
MHTEIAAKTVVPFNQSNVSTDEPYKDNSAHLMALEMEARIILLSAQQTSLDKPWHVSDATVSDINKSKRATNSNPPAPEELSSQLHAMQTIRRQREQSSIAQGIPLLFCKTCALYELDSFEQEVLMLLFVTANSHTFKVLLSKSIFKEYVTRSGLEAGAIISILEPDFTRQIQKRGYFSVDARLIRHELIVCGNSYFAPDESILDAIYYVHQRIANFIMGDNNIYSQEMTCIEKIQSKVDLARLILPGNTKQTVIEHVSNYIQAAARSKDLQLNAHIGYGTGMVCLFYGPSGTGKTMLAHGLAQHFGMRLLIINMEKANHDNNIEDIIKYAFKEARLTNSIVFFDECDDLFKEGTRDSRTLLIEIEKANCIIILATNKTIAMDPALDRRIQLKLPILLPGTDEREHIWISLLPEGIQLSPDVDFRNLAEKYRFSGGLIKNAVMAAIAMAIHAGDESQVTITQAMFERAAQTQSNHSMQQVPFGTIVTPQMRIAQLSLKNQDKNRLRHLSECEINGQLDPVGKATLVVASEIPTALEALEAVAAESHQSMWIFTLSELMEIESKKLLAHPLTHEPMELREMPFITLGQRTMTVIIDDNESYTAYLKSSEAKPNELEVLLNCMEFSKKHVYLAMKGSSTATRLTRGVARVIQLGPPSDIRQIDAWRENLKDAPDIDRYIHEMIERHPMHPSKIKGICHEAEIRSMIEYGTDMHMNDFVVKVVQGLQIATPILFGNKQNIQRSIDTIGHFKSR